MSTPDPKRDLTVSADEFIRFLESESPVSKCEACGNEKWTILSVRETDEATRFSIVCANTPEKLRLPLFGLYCQKCGNLRFHLAALVKEWVSSQGDVTPAGGADADKEADASDE